MRWVSYCSGADGEEHAAVLVGSSLRGVERTMLEILRSDGSFEVAYEEASTDPFEILDYADANLLAPLPTPPSIRDFMSFEDHLITAMGAIGQKVDPVWYSQPVFYFTNPAAVRAPVAEIPVSPGSEEFDFELEIAAVIGRRGSDITLEDAESYIAGYTVLCDWSARDLQASEMKVGIGPAKGKDSATSLGPHIVTPDELEPFRRDNGYDLTMTASVNGRDYSAGNWSSLYWSMAQMIVQASRGTELRPGDVLGSGTVGTGCILELQRVHGAVEYPYLSPGDEVVLEVQELGRQIGRIIPGAAPAPLN